MTQPRLLCLLVILAVGAAPRPACAQMSVTYYYSLADLLTGTSSVTETGYSSLSDYTYADYTPNPMAAPSLAITPFNSALGTLESVTISVDLTYKATVAFSSGLNTGTMDYYFQGRYGSVDLTLNGTTYATTPEPGDQITSWYLVGDSNACWFNQPLSTSATFTSASVNASTWAALQGSSTVLWTWSSSENRGLTEYRFYSVSLLPYDQMSVLFTLEAATISVTYTYSAIPEPATYAVALGAAALGLVGLRLRRRA